MDTQQRSGTSVQARRKESWGAAFASRDPAQIWGAACSGARMVTGGDRWVDSSALHEAACGAFDSITEAAGTNRVSTAVLGARRALHWERQARDRLVPPVDDGEHRWRNDTNRGGAAMMLVTPFDIGAPMGAAHPRPESTVATWLGDALDRAGWAFPLAARDAVADTIDVCADVCRELAPAAVRDLHPAFSPRLANNLVLLVAGSRQRDGAAWPGVVWLDAHYGRDAAAEDNGTQNMISAVVSGRRGRPVATINTTDRVAQGQSADLSRWPQRPARPAGKRVEPRAVAS